jgi:L-cysteate sulfo-lyase
MLLSRFPRVNFIHAPTPLEELPRLSKHLGGPALLVKRDDCTGLALGGNKARKLEFLIGAATARGADTLLTAGGVQSNHCRQTAAAAAKYGFASELFLTRSVQWNEPTYERTGNVLLDRLTGAKLHFVPRDTDLDQAMARRAEELKKQGKKPFVVPVGGSTPTGALGYVSSAVELVAQANERGLVVDHVVHASGSGGTQAGLIVGLEGANSGVPVIGISVSRPKARLEAEVRALVQGTADSLGLQHRIAADRTIVLDEYIGSAYGQPTPAMIEAVELCARLEGLVLDPVYTGKAMAGLIDLVRKKRFKPTDTVVFIHTGGTPALFAYDSIFDAAP